ncbi:MAG: hypothetical protein HDR44_03265 [Allobaculum sp.]|nr:hypothetical protein [Allobaculum sp.]
MRHRIRSIISLSLIPLVGMGCSTPSMSASTQDSQTVQEIDEVLLEFENQEMTQVPQTSKNGKIKLIQATRSTVLVEALEDDGSFLDALNQLQEEGLVEFTDVSTEDGVAITSVYGLANGLNKIRELWETNDEEMLSLKDYKEVYGGTPLFKWKVFTSLNQKEDRFYTYGSERTWDVDGRSVFTTEAYVPINKLPFVASNYYALTYEVDIQAIIERQLQEES